MFTKILLYSTANGLGLSTVIRIDKSSYVSFWAFQTYCRDLFTIHATYSPYSKQGTTIPWYIRAYLNLRNFDKSA